MNSAVNRANKNVYNQIDNYIGELVITHKGAVYRVYVDHEDYIRIKDIRWCLSSGYVRNGNTGLYLHRHIMNAAKGFEVDHRNRNPLDNRKANLLICVRPQNMQNEGLRSNSTTKLKGVHFRKGLTKPYAAQIMVNRKLHFLGYYSTGQEAAYAYDQACSQLHGEFAVTNASLGLI